MEYDFAYHNSHMIEYRSPFGAVQVGSIIKISILTNENVDVYLKVIDYYGKDQVIRMNSEGKNNNHILHSAEVNTFNLLGFNQYYFIIKVSGREYYYGNNVKSLGGQGQIYYDNPIPYQITVYEESHIPKWYKQGIIYQIFVDRFYNGNHDGKINSPKDNSFIYAKWTDEPMYIKNQSGEILRWDFYGGNLRGVIEKLSYLNELGVTIIYFNPIFESVSCHKYDTGNYEIVDPMFGNEEDFKELCYRASKYGIRIILDGVFSHTGSDSKYFNRFGNYNSIGACQSKESKYYNWYKFDDYPNKYECWWGFDNQPDVDELNPSYLNYIVTSEKSIISKWMKLGVSGWRLDVADELPDKFIEILKTKIKEIDGESILIGEVWEDASNKVSYSQRRRYLYGKELDSVTNYPLRNGIINYVKGDIDGNLFSDIVYSLYENYPLNNFYSTMNLLGNHDTERILTVLNEDMRLLELALVIQMVLPGVPLIFYGDEVGLTGCRDPSNRKSYPWGKENLKIYGLYKKLISIRKNSLILLNGDFNIKSVDKDLVIITRAYKGKTVVIILNNSLIEKKIELNNTSYIVYKDIIENKVIIKNDKENYIFAINGKGYKVLCEC